MHALQLRIRFVGTLPWRFVQYALSAARQPGSQAVYIRANFLDKLNNTRARRVGSGRVYSVPLLAPIISAFIAQLFSPFAIYLIIL